MFNFIYLFFKLRFKMESMKRLLMLKIRYLNQRWSDLLYVKKDWSGLLPHINHMLNWCHIERTKYVWHKPLCVSLYTKSETCKASFYKSGVGNYFSWGANEKLRLLPGTKHIMSHRTIHSSIHPSSCPSLCLLAVICSLNPTHAILCVM